MKAIIPCAGRNSRFGYMPKALAEINGQKNIKSLLEIVQAVVLDVVIVSDSHWRKDFETIASGYSNVKVVVDDSYGGETRAIITAIEKEKIDDDLLIVWGDTIYTSFDFLNTFIKRTLKNSFYVMHIPVRFESNPYLAIILDSNGNPCDVSFSKETSGRQPVGFHDLSTFILNRSALRYLHSIRISADGEMKFLSIIKTLYAAGEKIKLYEFDGRNVSSFNTQEEFNEILELGDSISIRLPRGKQEILIGENFLMKAIQEIKSSYDKFMVFIDKTAYLSQKEYYDELLKSINIHDFELIFIKIAPQNKNLKETEVILQKFISAGMSRKSCVIIIGGGSIADMVGFAASIYMRGIDFIQIPTTVMGQVDPIIGKVAVNFQKTKNAIGSFSSPRYTFCDISLIKSFPEQDVLHGLVEVWKHALLVNDLSIRESLDRFLLKKEKLNWIEIIKFSLITKRNFAEKDPWDVSGSHKGLSLGHTLANVLEMQKNMNHGLAVFYGIIFEFLLSLRLGKIGSEKRAHILETASLFEVYFKNLEKIKKLIKHPSFLKKLKNDKINSYKIYTFVIPTENSYEVCKVPLTIVEETINDFLEFNFLSKSPKRTRKTSSPKTATGRTRRRLTSTPPATASTSRSR